MTTAAMNETANFAPVLIAESRAAGIAEPDDLYGWLIGSWELDVLDYDAAGNVQRGDGEVHFARVLEGRAVQDVWIMPRRVAGAPPSAACRNRYGMTLRVWDPAIGAWRVTWINPVSGSRDELIGRRVGKDLVQVGTHANGVPIRWSFTDIAPNGFRWIGEALEPDGKTWRLEAEFHARRLG